MSSGVYTDAELRSILDRLKRHGLDLPHVRLYLAQKEELFARRVVLMQRLFRARRGRDRVQRILAHLAFTECRDARIRLHKATQCHSAVTETLGS
jgi:hypothetical protein